MMTLSFQNFTRAAAMAFGEHLSTCFFYGDTNAVLGQNIIQATGEIWLIEEKLRSLRFSQLKGISYAMIGSSLATWSLKKIVYSGDWPDDSFLHRLCQKIRLAIEPCVKDEEYYGDYDIDKPDEYSLLIVQTTFLLWTYTPTILQAARLITIFCDVKKTPVEACTALFITTVIRNLSRHNFVTTATYTLCPFAKIYEMYHKYELSNYGNTTQKIISFMFDASQLFYDFMR